MHIPAQPPDFPPVFLPFLFIGMWLLVSFISSLFGWRSFSNHYPAQIRPPGIAYNSPSASFGFLGQYSNVVRVVITDAGVYFYALFLFRAFHPPFLVPWDSVRSIEKIDGFFGSYYWLEIKNDAGKVRLRLPERIQDELSKYHKAA